MAPERISTGQSDPRGDIYALACVLYECLTGSHPFPGNSLEKQITAHLTKPPPRPSAMRPGIPALLDTVIATGMAKEPDQRYPSAKDLAHAARAALTTPLPRPSPPPAAPTMPAPYVERGTGLQRPPGLTMRPDAQLAGGVLPPRPTQYRLPADRATGAVTPGAGGTGEPPGSQPSTRKLIWGAWGAAAIGVVAIIALISLIAYRVAAPGNKGSTTGSATPNTGPFTGTFTVDFGPQTTLAGQPRQDRDAAPVTETWKLRSMCRPSGCVATAWWRPESGVNEADEGSGFRG
jgi:serine/threonine kinase PknH